MTTHRPHPIQGDWHGKQYEDDERAVLFDDCPRCNEHAKSVITLDDNNLKRIWDEMMLVEFTHGGRDYYHSINDSTASFFLYKVILINQRLFGLSKEQCDALKEAQD